MPDQSFTVFSAIIITYYNDDIACDAQEKKIEFAGRPGGKMANLRGGYCIPLWIRLINERIRKIAVACISSPLPAAM